MKQLDDLVRKNVQDLLPYSSARDEFYGTEGIFLDANENPFGHYNRYPDPYQKTLKKRVAVVKNIPESQVFIGNGSDEAIDLLFRIFCEPRADKALTFTPTYGMYKVSAAINDVELIEVPLTENFQIAYDSVLPFLDHPDLKLIFICSPNNPTGNSVDRKTIENIIENFKGIVVIDEAYIDFSQEFSLTTWLAKYPQLVILQTLSKAWGQAGLRIGFAFAAKEIISYFNKVKPPYNISQVNQQLALKTLENTKDFEDKKAVILSEKELLQSELSELKGVYRVFSTDTNFILIQIKNANEVYKALVAEKLIIRNRSSQIKDALRITVGTPSENKKLLKTLQKIIR